MKWHGEVKRFKNLETVWNNASCNYHWKVIRYSLKGSR